MTTLKRAGRFIAISILVVLFLVLAALIWGAGIEPRLIDERHETAVVPGLPDVWQGRGVAVIADLQIGMWLDNADTIREIVHRIVRERPAVVLLAGDFVYHPTGESSTAEVREEMEPEDVSDAVSTVKASVALLQPMVAAGIPVFAVLGNHDYGMATKSAVKQDWLARRVTQALEDAGIPVLQNEARRVPVPGSGGEAHEDALYVVGIGSRYAGNDHPAAALAQVPDDVPRIVVMHNPDTFAAVPAGAAPFAVAGHTHGGQIRIPWTDDWTWMTLIEDDKVHADGWIEDAYGRTGNHLYVNRGIGFSLVPVRINAVPELTWFELRNP